jgi:hypothetical protein
VGHWTAPHPSERVAWLRCPGNGGQYGTESRHGGEAPHRLMGSRHGAGRALGGSRRWRSCPWPEGAVPAWQRVRRPVPAVETDTGPRRRSVPNRWSNSRRDRARRTDATRLASPAPPPTCGVWGQSSRDPRDPATTTDRAAPMFTSGVGHLMTPTLLYRHCLAAFQPSSIATDRVSSWLADRGTTILVRYAWRPLTLAAPYSIMEKRDRVILLVYRPSHVVALVIEPNRAIVDEVEMTAMVLYERTMRRVESIAGNTMLRTLIRLLLEVVRIARDLELVPAALLRGLREERRSAPGASRHRQSMSPQPESLNRVRYWAASHRQKRGIAWPASQGAKGTNAGGNRRVGTRARSSTGIREGRTYRHVRVAIATTVAWKSEPSRIAHLVDAVR